MTREVNNHDCIKKRINVDTNIYDLDGLFESITSMIDHIYLGQKQLEATIIICGFLGNCMHESGNFSVTDEISQGRPKGPGGICNVPYKRGEWQEDSDKLKDGELMPCSCAQYNNYMGPSYIGKPRCDIDFTMDISAVEGGMECKPGKKSQGCCFWGRGPIQVTGQHNYKELDTYIKTIGKKDDLCKHPELVATKEYIWLSGLWFWMNHVQTASSYEPHPDNPSGIYTKSLSDYAKLIRGKDSNATNMTYLKSQTPPTFLSAVSGAINQGQWNNKADKNETRICNSLRILQKLQIVQNVQC